MSFQRKVGVNVKLSIWDLGFDTLHWRLKDSNKNVTNFVEMDFPSVAAQKYYLIKKNEIFT